MQLMNCPTRVVYVSFMLLVLSCIDARESRGDMLLLKGQTEPVYGYLNVKKPENQDKIRFFVYDETSNQFYLREFAKTEVRLVVPTVDQQRLSQLTIARLDEMYEYAEELAGHRNDAIARRLARRLVLVCIYCGSNRESASGIVKSAARTLVGLAKSDVERDHFEQLGFVYSSATFDTAQSGASDQRIQTRLEKMASLEIIQALRREKFALAANLLETDATGFANAWSRFDVQQAIQDRKLNADLKRELIATELRIRFGKGTGPSFENIRGKRSPTSLNIIDVADFDLRASDGGSRPWLEFEGLPNPVGLLR